MSIPFSRRTLAAAICLFPLAATAQSQNSADAPSTTPVSRLSEIVVTPSRMAEPLSDVVGDVTVIGPEQLANAPGESLAQIIGQAPGVQFTTNGGPQTATGLYLRGASTNQSLILIDGMRINGSTSGGAAFPAIDPAMVERIEIVRGAASSLYGSDAIGGVINIITKKGEQDRPLSAWANVGYGTYETSKSSLGLSGASDGWDYSLSASANDSKGFDATRKRMANNSDNLGHYADKDGYRSHAVSGTLGYRWAEGHRIGLTAYNSQIRGDYDAGSSVPDAYAFYRQQAYGVTSTDRITDWWESDLKFGFTKDGYDDRTYNTLFNSLKRQYSWINTVTPIQDQHLSLLLERQEERVESSTQYDQAGRNTNAVGLIYKGKFDRLHTQASVRNDNYTDYGNQATGSLGLDFDLTNAWQVGIAGNTGFRAPTFNDMYTPFTDYGYGDIFQGNPNLKPEKSKNIEAHVQYQTEATLVRATIYQNRIRNLISGYVFDPALGYNTAKNTSRATIRGLTLTGEQRLGDTTLRASADFLDPRNDTPQAAQGYFPAEGSTLLRRARQVFHASVEHRIQALKLGAEYEYTGNRYDDAANQTRLGGFSLVNLTAAYDFSKSLGVQVRWNNVFDKDYVLVDGYNTPGSNVFVNLSWRM
ncbi:TonB-dependent receptor domain-containing protein [Castellaniella caeni]|uniref:TonB-dependent receptor domain-containing protein n=1 Tax=Castellaniella caeni TaxID=266123 RepID=UPI00082BD03E|nr:TonB-dependent receptor [Castellaniella caeni]